MRLTGILTIIVALFSFTNNSVYAQTSGAKKAKRGTPQEAIAMVKRVKRMYRTIGPEKTLRAVSKLTHNLRDRDLYPYVVHMEGFMAAHFLSSLRGLSFREHTDSRGRPFFKLMMKVAGTKGKGWVTYSFPSPVTKKVEEKSAYLERLDKDFFVAVGVYAKVNDDEIIN